MLRVGGVFAWFYKGIFVSAVSDYRSMTSKLQFWGAAFLAVAGLFSRQWADRVSRTWKGISPWWALAPIGLFIFYRVLRANYEAFAALEKSREERDNEENIQSVLGELLSHGADLRIDFIEAEFQLSLWISRFNHWRQEVLDALGEFGLAADYALFQNADVMGDAPPIGAITWQEQVKEYDQILRNHLYALAGILRTRPKTTFKTKELHERERF
jgi:hypothetical protein